MSKSPRDRFNKLFGSLHARIYRASKGKIAGKMQGAPMFLLTTTGAKSGQSRTSPLIYLEDGGDYIVVASNAGQNHAPGWFHNLQKTPTATVEVSGRTVPVHATAVAKADYPEMWAKLDGIFKGYATYRGKTSRDIPLVRLTPHL